VTLEEALRAAEADLAAAAIEDAWLEAEVLLRHALGVDRAHLLSRLREPLSPAEDAAFRALLKRRLAHEPTAYIVGHREFYGLELKTGPAALIPRPETELLVEEVLNALKGEGPSLIADIGTGNGAVAVALAVNLPTATVHAIDTSEAALALAQRNAERHGVADRVRFHCGDLLGPLPEPVDAIAANLPYVKSDDWETLPPEIREHEPRLALDGGPTGLREIERLLREAPDHLRPGGLLAVEIAWDQGEAAVAIARECFPRASVSVKRDLAGLDRLLIVQMPPEASA
jgi:release factor glutamine methyltransferase